MPRSPTLRPLTVYGTPQELDLIRAQAKKMRMSASSWVMFHVLKSAKEQYEGEARRRMSVDEFIGRALQKPE